MLSPISHFHRLTWKSTCSTATDKAEQNLASGTKLWISSWISGCSHIAQRCVITKLVDLCSSFRILKYLARKTVIHLVFPAFQCQNSPSSANWILTFFLYEHISFLYHTVRQEALGKRVSIRPFVTTEFFVSYWEQESSLVFTLFLSSLLLLQPCCQLQSFS